MKRPGEPGYVCQAHRFKSLAGGKVTVCRCVPPKPGPDDHMGTLLLVCLLAVVCALVGAALGSWLDLGL